MPRGREPLFVYDAGHELGGDPPVELVLGEPERKGRVNKSVGFDKAEMRGDAVAV